jgi:hypothetical protein
MPRIDRTALMAVYLVTAGGPVASRIPKTAHDAAGDNTPGISRHDSFLVCSTEAYNNYALQTAPPSGKFL